MNVLSLCSGPSRKTSTTTLMISTTLRRRCHLLQVNWWLRLEPILDTLKMKWRKNSQLPQLPLPQLGRGHVWNRDAATFHTTKSPAKKLIRKKVSFTLTLTSHCFCSGHPSHRGTKVRGRHIVTQSWRRSDPSKKNKRPVSVCIFVSRQAQEEEDDDDGEMYEDLDDRWWDNDIETFFRY